MSPLRSQFYPPPRTPVRTRTTVAWPAGLALGFSLACAVGQEAPPAADRALIVEQLLQRSDRSPEALGSTIARLTRLQQFAEVESLLAADDVQSLAGAEAARLADRIEPAMVLRILSSDQIDDAAKTTLRRFVDQAESFRRSPQRLAAAIDDLDVGEVDRRLAARRTLLAGGDAAVTQLVSAAVDESPSAPVGIIRQTIDALTDRGDEALSRVAVYADPATRSRALAVLTGDARIGDNRATLSALSALHAANGSDAERQVAAAFFSNQGQSLPGRREAIEILRADLQRKRDRLADIDNDEATATTWVINADRDGVIARTSRQFTLAHLRATDAAARLRRLGVLPFPIRVDAITADLAYRIVIDPDWGGDQQRRTFRDRYALDRSSWIEAIRLGLVESMRARGSAATLGWLRLIDPEDPASVELLRAGANTDLAPLVVAASSPIPTVRYEAALVAASISGVADPPMSFAGASSVATTLREMTRLGDRPTALVVETRPEVSLILEEALVAVGLDTEVVTSVTSLERRVAAGGDVRLILSKTLLSDFAPIELVDRVRRLSRGTIIPIAFFGEQPIGVDIVRSPRGGLVGPVEYLKSPQSAAVVADLLSEFQTDRALPPLSPADRRFYAIAAVQKLEKFRDRR